MHRYLENGVNVRMLRNAANHVTGNLNLYHVIFHHLIEILRTSFEENLLIVEKR